MNLYPCPMCGTFNVETSVFCRDCGCALQLCKPYEFDEILNLIKRNRFGRTLDLAMRNNRYSIKWGRTSLVGYPNCIKNKNGYEVYLESGVYLYEDKDFTCCNSITFERNSNIYKNVEADIFRYFDWRFSFKQVSQYLEQFFKNEEFAFEKLDDISETPIWNPYFTDHVGYLLSMDPKYKYLFDDRENKVSSKNYGFIFATISIYEIMFVFNGYSNYQGNTLERITISYQNCPKRNLLQKLFW